VLFGFWKNLLILILYEVLTCCFLISSLEFWNLGLDSWCLILKSWINLKSITWAFGIIKISWFIIMKLASTSSTFNVSALSLFDANGESDLRANPSQEGENDEDMTKSKGKDPLEGLGWPMTRARARKSKEALQQVLSILFEYKPMFQGEKSKVVSCIITQMEED